MLKGAKTIYHPHLWMPHLLTRTTPVLSFPAACQSLHSFFPPARRPQTSSPLLLYKSNDIKHYWHGKWPYYSFRVLAYLLWMLLDVVCALFMSRWWLTIKAMVKPVEWLVSNYLPDRWLKHIFDRCNERVVHLGFNARLRFSTQSLGDIFDCTIPPCLFPHQYNPPARWRGA